MNGINKRRGTISAAKSTILAWIKFAGLENAKPPEVEDTHISPFINRDGFQKASTRNTQIAVISAFFGWMMAKGYVSHNVCAIVAVDMTKLQHAQKETARRTWVSDDDFAKILKVVDADEKDNFWKHAARIGRATALRLSDVANLEWANVSSKSVTVWMRKTEKRVSIPMPDEIADILSKIEKTDDAYVFPLQRLGYDCLSMQFTRICKKAGVSASFHSLRRSKLDEIVKSGGTLEDARAFAGHSSTKTTKGYIKNL
jgi:integrase